MRARPARGDAEDTSARTMTTDLALPIVHPRARWRARTAECLTFHNEPHDKMLEHSTTEAHIAGHFHNELQDKMLVHSTPEAHIAAQKTSDSGSATPGKGARRRWSSKVHDDGGQVRFEWKAK